MTLYSKLGSYPKPETDGTDGWIEVPEPPVAGEGEEVVWWFPPGWVVRPVKPVRSGYEYNWSQSEGRWVESWLSSVVDLSEPGELIGSATESVTMTTASETVSLGSAGLV